MRYFNLKLQILMFGLVPTALAQSNPSEILENTQALSELLPPNKRIGDVYELVYQIKTATDANAPKASYGSAFVVHKDGLLATNFHVVSSALFEPGRYRLFFIDGDQSIEATVVAFDVVNDLAILRVNHSFGRAVLLASHPPHVGAKIYSIGLPEDLNKSIIEGNFNGVVVEGPYQKVQMSIPLNPGMSGGPTVDEFGRIIGINVSLRQDSQNLAFSVPVQLLKQLLKKTEIPFPGKRFNEETKKQLEDVQDELTKIFTKGKNETIKMHDWVASRPKLYVKCWRESDASNHNLFQRITEICYLPNSASLNNTVDLGTFKLRFQATFGPQLNDLQFLSKLNYSITRTNLETVDFIEGFTTKFQCEELDLINSYAIPLKIHYCINGFVNYPGLYNLELRAVTLSRKKSTFQVQISLSGFSAMNLWEITKIVIDDIHPETGS